MFCWLDLETTGLNPDNDRILELAFQVGDHAGQGALHSMVLHAGNSELSRMHPAVQTMHETSGLLEACKASTLMVQEAEQRALDVLKDKWMPNELNLAGNSVWFDHAFLRRHMPRLADFFHYRMLDMSAVALFGETLGHPRPEWTKAHRAGPDIGQSQAMFMHYRALLGAKAVQS